MQKMLLEYNILLNIKTTLYRIKYPYFYKQNNQVAKYKLIEKEIVYYANKI